MITEKNIYFLVVVFMLTLVACCQADTHKGGEEQMQQEIQYWSNAADEMLPTELSISNQGMATLKLRTMRNTTNATNASVVGLFQMQLDELRLQSLNQALNTKEFVALSNPTTFIEGEVLRKLTCKKLGQPEMVKIASGSAARAPAFLQAENAAKALLSDVQKHPLYALSIEVPGPSPQLHKGEPLDITVVIANRGYKSVRIPSPDAWHEKMVSMTLEALRSDVPANDLKPFHQKFEMITKADLKQANHTDIADKFITLPPGGKSEFILSKRLTWEAGSYNLRISVQLPLENMEGQEVLRCELLSDIFNLLT